MSDCIPFDIQTMKRITDVNTWNDHIPFDIQEEIMIRLSVKSLIRFRCVSKPWKSLIHSSKFITDYHINHTQPRQHHLLVSYDDSGQKYLCIDDNDSFPQHKFLLTVPTSTKLLYATTIIGSSKGFFCLYGYYNSESKKKKDVHWDPCPRNSAAIIVVLWNPSVRKSVSIVVPVFVDTAYHTRFGFGVSLGTNDPKLVMITQNISGDIIRCLPWQVEMIISFDLTSEEFGEVYFPDCIAPAYGILSMSKLGECLVVLESFKEIGKPVCDAWMMEHGVSKSFRKLYTVKVPDNLVYVGGLGFRKNGKLIVEMVYDHKELIELGVYEHCLRRINDLGVYARNDSFDVSSYTESLLLLNELDSLTH